MKTILAIVSALLMGSAYAQTGSNFGSNMGRNLAAANTPNAHMLEFNTDSILQGVFSFDKNKTKGTSADNDTNLSLSLNYAYSLAAMPRLQLGSRINYSSGAKSGRGDFEDYGLQIGAILNREEDLQNSPYVSLYFGPSWSNTYGPSTFDREDETWTTTLALGKRFALDRFGIKHLTYTPEIAFQNRSSTTGAALQYSQSLQLRVLQFSVFF